MIIAICGGRDYNDVYKVYSSLNALHGVKLVVHGNARGADMLADRWAIEMGIHVARIPALWEFYGRLAGIKRNTAMNLINFDKLIAFPGGSGTADMIEQVEARSIEVIRIT